MANFLRHWQSVTHVDGRTGIVKDIDGYYCHVIWLDYSLTWEHAADLTGGDMTEPGRC